MICATNNRTRLRILLVDDEPQILRALRRILHRHETIAVPCGELAIQVLEADRFDVIVSDNSMGMGMSGIELLTWVAHAHPHVLRVMHSGSQPPQLAQLREADIVEWFILKPGDGNVGRVCGELGEARA